MNDATAAGDFAHFPEKINSYRKFALKIRTGGRTLEHAFHIGIGRMNVVNFIFLLHIVLLFSPGASIFAGVAGKRKAWRDTWHLLRDQRKKFSFSARLSPQLSARPATYAGSSAP